MALRAVPEHPKFFALKDALHLRKYHALGILEALWHFAGKFAPQGNVGKFNNAAIEAWLEWDGERGVLIAALTETGWLDSSEEHRLVIHDWHEHADQTTRKQLGRAKKVFVSDMSGQSMDMSGQNGKVSGPPEPVPVPVPEPVPEPEPEPKATSTALAVPAGKLVCTLPLNQGEHEVYDVDVKQWTELYLAVDVRQELRNIKGWLIGNPRLRKTKTGINRFITSWLSRAQNEAKPTQGATHGRTHGKTSGNLDAASQAIAFLEAGDRAAADEVRGTQTGPGEWLDAGDVRGGLVSFPALGH